MPRKPTAAPTIVTLTSDFGSSDAYVAEMKGAILREAGRAVMVDITHQIAPQDIVAGSIALERAVAGFPAETVHLAVVDPGVGSDRRILVARLRGSTVICPDNGLITWAWHRQNPGIAAELTWRPDRTSDTFHGRDIMAPAAGMIAAGTSAAKLSRPISDPVLLDLAPVSDPAASGRIIHIDHFGNAMTNITREALPLPMHEINVRVGRRRLPLRRSYSDVRPGEPLTLIGSAGLLEIAVRNGSAAQALSIRVGQAVRLD